MEKIRKLYDEYQISEKLQESIPNPFYLVLGVEALIKEWIRGGKVLARKKRKNRIVQKLVREPNEILKGEEECFTGMENCIEDNIDMMAEILEVLSEENFEELRKLVDFIVIRFTENQKYWQSRLESLKIALNGIQYFDPRVENQHEKVKAFVEEKLTAMKTAKQLEKKSEI